MTTMPHHRLLLAFSGGVYLAWWFVVEAMLPTAFNPLGSRLFVCGTFFAALAASYGSSLVAKHLRLIFSACIALLTAHYFYLFSRNAQDPNWLIGCFITILAAGVTLETLPVLLAYSVLVLVGTLYVAAQLSLDAVGLPGVVTVLILINLVAALRHRAAREQRLRIAAEAEKTAAIALDRAKMLFLANVNHELRTPLGGVIGYADLLAHASGNLAPEEREWVMRLQQNASNLHSTLEEILALTESDVMQLPREAEQFDLRELVAARVAAGKAAASGKAVDVRLSFDEAAPRFVRSDRRHVAHVFDNVFGNALKFTGSGAIDVRVGASPGAQPNTVRAAIAIEDTGVGIPPEKWEQVFAPFHQADMSYTRAFQGAGLGLTVARMLARTLGGDVTVERSTPGGTTMLFTWQVGL